MPRQSSSPALARSSTALALSCAASPPICRARAQQGFFPINSRPMRMSAVALAYFSQQPRWPQWHGSPSTTTTMWADFAAHAVRAAHHLAVQHHAAAHAGAECDEYAAAHAARGAESALRQCRGVGVIVHGYGQAEAIVQARHQRHAHPAEVVAEGHQAGPRVLLAGDAHAHGGKFRRVAATFADEAAAEPYHVRGDVLKIAADAVGQPALASICPLSSTMPALAVVPPTSMPMYNMVIPHFLPAGRAWRAPCGDAPVPARRCSPSA